MTGAHRERVEAYAKAGKLLTPDFSPQQAVRYQPLRFRRYEEVLQPRRGWKVFSGTVFGSGLNEQGNRQLWWHLL
jgi:hypothetical protein